MRYKHTNNNKMATILINNPSEDQILQYIDSNNYYLEANKVILAMSDLKRWFMHYKNLSDFLFLDHGYYLCKLDDSEEIYSEEETLITAG